MAKRYARDDVGIFPYLDCIPISMYNSHYISLVFVCFDIVKLRHIENHIANVYDVALI